MKIIIGADHAGFATKEFIKKKNANVDFVDLSPVFKEGDDYPDVAKKVAKRAIKDNTKAILVCGSGVGVAMAANKVKGVRAAQVTSAKQAKLAVQHNSANIITLPGRNFKKTDTTPIVQAFMKATPSEDVRHKRRVKKIQNLEK